MKTLQISVHWKPYGSNLLTAKANTWFIFAAALVFMMAFVEAIAWGNLGYFVGEGAVRWAAAGIVFITIFSVVAIVDLSLINLDRASREHAKIFIGDPTEGWEWRWHLALGTRIAMVLLSLLISAPLLSLLIFRSDVDRVIEVNADAAIDAKRHEMLTSFNESLTKQDDDIRIKRDRYELEVAGKGPSGHYGQGPAAQAILRDVEALERARQGSIQQNTRAQSEFETLASNWKVNSKALAAKYDLQLPAPSVLENRLALEEITSNAAFKHTEHAIQAILGFIFAGILLLKLYQPRSVLLYQSELLQEKYLAYLDGAYNSWLPFKQWPSETSFATSPEAFLQLLLVDVAEKIAKAICDLESHILAVQVELDALKADSDRLEEIHRKLAATTECEHFGKSDLVNTVKRSDDAWQISVKRVDSKRAELEELQVLLKEVKSRMRNCVKTNAIARLNPSSASH